MQKLSEKELHQLAMNTVGKSLEEDGFDFLAVNSEFKKDPQFVCTKDKELHFVVVRHVCYPDNPKKFDVDLMQEVKEHAIKFKAKTYFAVVGFAHADDYEKPLCKDEPYAVNYAGLQEV
ncbi:MAG: Na(+)-translocating NADH-quinone reductase subunit F [Flavobacteriaceae bacterium]